ncbi:MAG: hypothetical protein ACOYOV_15650 [Bacteroidales bacterium]
MKKKCLTTATKGVFIQNAIHTDIFDLIPESGANLPFSYFRISLPIQPYLIAQGAKYVVESHKCSYSQLSKLTAKNEVPMSKYGRRITFNSDELTKWVDSKKQKTIDVSMAVSKCATSKLQRA